MTGAKRCPVRTTRTSVGGACPDARFRPGEAVVSAPFAEMSEPGSRRTSRSRSQTGGRASPRRRALARARDEQRCPESALGRVAGPAGSSGPAGRGSRGSAVSPAPGADREVEERVRERFVAERVVPPLQLVVAEAGVLEGRLSSHRFSRACPWMRGSSVCESVSKQSKPVPCRPCCRGSARRRGRRSRPGPCSVANAAAERPAAARASDRPSSHGCGLSARRCSRPRTGATCPPAGRTPPSSDRRAVGAPSPRSRRRRSAAGSSRRPSRVPLRGSACCASPRLRGRRVRMQIGSW